MDEDDALFEWLAQARTGARGTRRDPDDEKALHSFRVGARRALAQAKVLGLPKRARRRLRRAMKACGPLRDLQVEAAWLSRHGLPGPRKRELRRARPSKRLLREAQRAARALGGKALKLDLPPSALLGLRRAAASRAAARLGRRLRRAQARPEPDSLHEARLAAKKLSDLLEALPAADRRAARKGALDDLRRALGAAHDADVMLARRAGGMRAAALLRRERAAAVRRARALWRRRLEVVDSELPLEV